MELHVVVTAGVTLVEGSSGEAFMRAVADCDRVIETCLSSGATSALLYPENLPAEFFDLSSGQAGAILQKLRNYRIRLAVVCPPGRIRFSSRFGELLEEERRGPHFRVFGSRQASLDWLTQSS